MPRIELRTGASIYYEEFGSGYPVLLFAPGGMESTIEAWRRAPYDPTVELADSFRLIAMDQRNAGRSFGPLEPTGWEEMAADHLALMDALGIRRAHVMGMCIGSSYCLRLIAEAPDRVTAAVLQNPIGLKGGNFDSFVAMFETAARTAEREGMEAVVVAALANDHFQQNPKAGLWANRIAADEAFRTKVASMDPAEYARIHRETAAAFFGRSDFVFSVSREWLATCRTPLLVLPGNDDFHPPEIAHEIARIAPNAELLEDWRSPEAKPRTVEAVRSFLRRHTPAE